jgi:uncharacterized iron-regulated protein
MLARMKLAQTYLQRLAVLVSFCALNSACTSVSTSTALSGELPGDEPLAGRILDVRAGRFITRDELVQHALGARFVILGEAHDNAGHHHLQTQIFESMLRGGRAPALAMEQFDREHQAALDSAWARGERDAEALADAGRFDRKGWRWPDYKPLITLAASRGLAILAANFSRAEARALMKSGRPAEGLAPASPELQAVLEKDIVEGHCGLRPSAPVLAGMIEAQRARDAQMARVLSTAGPAGAVLIAGSGHARRDRGVPAYLAPALQAHLLSIAFMEVDASGQAPRHAYRHLFDIVWFTPRAERDDPCKGLRMP